MYYDRFSRLLRHVAWKQREPILISTLHKFVTYLLRHQPTYLQPWDPQGNHARDDGVAVASTGPYGPAQVIWFGVSFGCHLADTRHLIMQCAVLCSDTGVYAAKFCHVTSLSWQKPEEELIKLLLIKVSDRDQNIKGKNETLVVSSW